MGLNLKTIISLLCISTAITLTSCQPDAIIANYACHKHYCSAKGPNASSDSIMGFTLITVYRSSANSNTLLINGKTTGTYSEKYSNSKQNAYITDYASTGEPLLVYFISGDSMWMQTDLVTENGMKSYCYIAGHKE